MLWALNWSPLYILNATTRCWMKFISNKTGTSTYGIQYTRLLIFNLSGNLFCIYLGYNLSLKCLLVVVIKKIRKTNSRFMNHFPRNEAFKEFLREFAKNSINSVYEIAIYFFRCRFQTNVRRSFPFSTKWYLCSVFILMTFIAKHFSFKLCDHIHPKTIKLGKIAMLICYMLMDLSDNSIWNMYGSHYIF